MTAQALFRMIGAIALSFVADIAAAQDAAVSTKQAESTASATAKPTCANVVGAWKNQLGSKMNIKSVVAATGAITGEYQTASGAGGWYPLVGWINSVPNVPGKNNAKIVSFSVRWGNVGSVTSWTGVCHGADDLKTVWNLGRPVSDYEWDHVLTGADNFRPD